MMIKPFSYLLLVSLISANVQALTYYKWTDANGTPHYSQYAPTNGVDLKKVQVITMRDDGRINNTGQMAEQNVPTTSQMPNPEGNLTPEQQRIKELEAQNKSQKEQADKERCKSLQNNLQNLNAGGRVYEMDNKGQRKYLDGREIELKKQKVQQAIQQYCK